MLSKLSLQIPITVLLLLLAPTLLMAETESAAKMRICHYNSKTDAEGKIIVISINALKAHKEHGDPSRYYILSKDRCKKLPQSSSSKK